MRSCANLFGLHESLLWSCLSRIQFIDVGRHTSIGGQNGISWAALRVSRRISDLLEIVAYIAAAKVFGRQGVDISSAYKRH